MAKKSSKRVPKLPATPPAQSVDDSATSVPQSVENPIDPLELVTMMELCLAMAASPFAGYWDNDNKFNSPREYLEANLGDNSPPAPNAFAELAEHLRDAYRSLKQFQAAIGQQDWGGACMRAFECGCMLMNGQRLLGLKAESIGVAAIVSRIAATKAHQDKAETSCVAAEVELRRRMEQNPNLTKTSALTAMAKEKKYGSLRSLQTNLKHVKREKPVD